MENILEVQQICKSFPKTKFVLDKVSFSIPYGSIMGFVGENGAGKTTFLKVLSGLLPTFRCESVCFCGHPVPAEKRGISRAHVGNGDADCYRMLYLLLFRYAAHGKYLYGVHVPDFPCGGERMVFRE